MTRQDYLTFVEEGKADSSIADYLRELINAMSHDERRALRSTLGKHDPLMMNLSYDYDKQVWI